MLAPATASARTFDFSIDAKPLGVALVDLAVQADISIATPPGGFGAARASTVRGDLSPNEALTRILQGTNYTFDQVDAVSFRVFTKPVEAPSTIAPTRTTDVIVTGARRPRTLDRLAVSATSTDGSFLDKTGARQTSDLAFDAAGITLTNLGPGRNKILVRGLSDGAFSGRTQATVGIYIDNSRITYGAPDPDLQLVDVEAVELLRGPQGALYGAGPISGIYHIISRSPDLKAFGGSVLGSVESVESGGIGSNFEAMVNLPLADGRAGIRAVAYKQHDAGWLDNTRLGLTDTNGTNRTGMRLNALARLGSTWTARGRFIVQRIDGMDSDYVDTTALGAARSARLLEPHATDFYLGSIDAQGAAAGGEITSVTSYTQHNLHERFDASAGSAPFGVSRARPVSYDDDADIELFVQELRYAAVASPVPWYIGAFYSDQHKRSETQIAANPDAASEQVGFYSDRSDQLSEFAVFGDVAFNLARNVQLSLAARYSWSQLSTSVLATGFPSDNFSGSRDDSGFAPKIELSYAPSSTRFFYVSAAKGYRSGGFNGGSAALLIRQSQPSRVYSGDTLWSYEAGAKQTVLDGKAVLRTAAFYQDWRNVQSDQLITLGLPFTGNVGDARSYGVEVESVWQASRDLQVRGHASYTNAEVTSPNTTFPARPRSGLPGAPRLLTGGTVIYERPIAGAMKMIASSRYSYVGRSNITYSRQRELRVGGYFDIDFRIGLATGAWTTAAYINNATNGQDRTFAYGNPLRFGGSGIVVPQTPRTVGLELSYNF